MIETPEAPARIRGLDLIRGVALLLMVADHSLVALDGPGWVRYLTRPALPLFMVVAGALIRPGLRRRQGEVLLAALTVELLLPCAGLHHLGILSTYLLAALPLWAGVPSWLWGTIALGWAANGGLPTPGYDPVIVAGLLCLGQLARAQLEAMASRLPASASLCALGRRPLTVMLVHVLALGALRGLL